MAYLAYNFTVTPTQPGSEILIALISDFGFDTFDYTNKGFTAFINEKDHAEINFGMLQFDDFSYTYTIEKIEDKNWNAEWEKNFEPVFVDDLLAIRAPFHAKDKEFAHEIIITPKMSFGTGHHETTRLMCKQMFNMDFRDKRVLDMGCGTGILAILAHFLKANDILGIDIDEWSVENSIENCKENNCSDIKIKKGNASLLYDEKPFDIILANINKNILKADMSAYSQKLIFGGKLVLSGFFTTDVAELTDVALRNQLHFKHSFNDSEWAMMVLEKR
jgi:ribosomal protein L11 methyltransferase